MPQKIGLYALTQDSGFVKSLKQSAPKEGFQFLGFESEGRAALSKIAKLLPDILFVDPSLMGLNGGDTLSQIKSESPSVKLVLLADPTTPLDTLFFGIKNGACGSVNRLAPLPELLKEVKDLYKGRILVTPGMAQRILDEFQILEDGAPEHPSFESLSESEYRLLMVALEGHSFQECRKILEKSPKAIAATLESMFQKLSINEAARQQLPMKVPETRTETLAEETEPPGEEETEAAREAAFDADEPDSNSKGGSAPALETVPQKVQESPQTPSKPTDAISGGERKMEDSQKKPQQKAASLADMTQLVTFKLKQEEFAVNITEVQEIIRMLSITTLPKVPDYVKGIVNLRGKIVPIFDLRKKLALEEISYSKETRIMVVNIEGTVMGMIVDSVSEVLRINEDTIEPPPPLVLGMSADYIKGVVNLTDRILILLDLPRLLTLEEQRKLQSLA